MENFKRTFARSTRARERGKKTLPAFAVRLLNQQERGERGKGTLPAFAVRLLNQQERGERGECSNKHIRTKNILKIHMENFNFIYIFFLLTITIHI